MSTECPTCSDSFDSETGMKIHHAKAHSESISGFEYDCAWCNKTVRKKTSQYEKAFCSDSCRDNWQSENWSGEDNPAYTGSKVGRNCDFCGEKFEIYQTQIEKGLGKYCSRSCKGKDKTGSDHPNWHDTSFECEECGEEVATTPYRSERGKFCSRVCKRENMRVNNYTSYGVGWLKKRDEIREKYDYRCEICGKEEGKKKHHVHHIIPVREFDKKEDAHFDENLVLLCKSHHHKVEQKPYVEQTEMFNKYPDQT